MKILYFLAVFVLLIKIGTCEETKPPTEDEGTTQMADSTSDPATENTYSADILQETQEDDTFELQDTLDNTDDGTVMKGSDDISKQNIHLRLKPGKGITIVLSPNGVLHGSGVTYTRWGKRSCPRGNKLIYEGYAAGGWFNHKGDGANYICMPRDPEYLSTTNVAKSAYLHGAEYETKNKVFGKKTQDYNVPCAICQAPRSQKLMIPGKVTCPKSWTREYFGYLMTSYYKNPQKALYECVDHFPDLVSGSKANHDGALFYFVTVVCIGLPCGPYHGGRAVTCTVCTI